MERDDVRVNIDLSVFSESEEKKSVSAKQELDKYAVDIAEATNMAMSEFILINKLLNRCRPEACQGLSESSSSIELREEGHELPSLFYTLAETDTWLQMSHLETMIETGSEALRPDREEVREHYQKGLSIYEELFRKRFQKCISHVAEEAEKSSIEVPLEAFLNEKARTAEQGKLQSFFHPDFPFTRWLREYAGRGLLPRDVRESVEALRCSQEACMDFRAFYISEEGRRLMPDFSLLFPTWKERKNVQHDYKRYLPRYPELFMFSISIPVLNGLFIFQLGYPYDRPHSERGYAWRREEIEDLKARIEREVPRTLISVFRRNYSIIQAYVREKDVPDFRQRTMDDVLMENQTAWDAVQDNSAVLDLMVANKSLSSRIDIASKNPNLRAGIGEKSESVEGNQGEYIIKITPSSREALASYQAYLLFQEAGRRVIETLVPHGNCILTRTVLGYPLIGVLEDFSVLLGESDYLQMKRDIVEKILQNQALFIINAPAYLASIREEGKHAAKFLSTVRQAWEEHGVELSAALQEGIERYGKLLERDSLFYFLDGNPLNEVFDYRRCIELLGEGKVNMPLAELPVLDSVAKKVNTALVERLNSRQLNLEEMATLLKNAHTRLDLEVCYRMTTLSDSFHELIGRPQTAFSHSEEQELKSGFINYLEQENRQAIQQGRVDYAACDFESIMERTYLITGIYRMLREWEIELTWMLKGYQNRTPQELAEAAQQVSRPELRKVTEKMQFYLDRTLDFLERMTGASARQEGIVAFEKEDPHYFFAKRLEMEQGHFREIDRLLRIAGTSPE